MALIMLSAMNRNRGQARGVGLLADRSTNVEINFCFFQQNKSSDIGGSIFSRGSMLVADSTFDKNSGQVSRLIFILVICYCARLRHQTFVE